MCKTVVSNMIEIASRLSQIGQTMQVGLVILDKPILIWGRRRKEGGQNEQKASLLCHFGDM